MRSAVHSALAIIVASSALVNAADTPLTKKLPNEKSRIARLISTLSEKGTTAPLTIAAAKHGLIPKIPIKYFEVSLDGSPRNTRLCDLIFSDHTEPSPKKPDSLLVMSKSTVGNTIEFKSYRYSLDGKLLSAGFGRGKCTDDGTPIKGTLVNVPIDASDPAVQKDAGENFEFWISGKYSRYRSPPQSGGAAPESAKKAAATAAK